MIFFARLVGPSVVAAYRARRSLAGANLRDADLRDADLRDANLRDANLRDANLSGANLSGAKLSGANLSDADLRDANLSYADLRDADLRDADLSGADLRDANLGGTCLDPQAEIPVVTDAAIEKAGLQIDGDRVYGWRTARSRHVGSTVYEPGTTHRAPWFSVADTECHPGIYLAGRQWLAAQYPGEALVRVSCRRCDLHHAGDKWRAREIRVEDATP